MRKSLTLIAAALVAAAISAGAALASTHSFTAKYSGRVTEKVVDQSVTATVAGKGTGLIVKASTLRGTVRGSQANACSPLSGPGQIKSKAGTIKLTIVSSKSRGCAAGEDDKNHINVSGKVKVLGGTGKFKGAKGLLTMKGTYNRSSGLFSVKFSGSLKY